MIHRTYVVNFPGAQRAQPVFVDICVRATMGTRPLPVADPATYGAGNVTPPPAGWVAVCGGAAYYELRGRTISFERLFAAGAAGGFTERARLGFHLSLTPYGDWTAFVAYSPPCVQLSQSLLAALGGDVGTAIPATNLADPVYGIAQPVIRVFVPRNGAAAHAVGPMLVNFSIAERKDEDFSPAGGP